MIKQNLLRRAWGKFLKNFQPSSLAIRQTTFREKCFLVKANEDVGWRIIANNDFENDQLNCLEQLIKEEDTCLDVGGNIGIYSVFMASKAKHGHVHVYEPISLNRDLIRTNLTLNQLENASIHKSILSNKNGVIDFCVSTDSAYSSIKSTGRKEVTEIVSYESCTIDSEFFHRNIKIDIIKIDVEGADLLVLQGAENLLKSDTLSPRAVLVESNARNQKAYDYTEADLVAYMAKFKYVPKHVNNKGVIDYDPSNQSLEEIIFLRQ